ncbi:hypothetical protein [Vibrio lentus]|uniref:hypothetical protein n=1 Tax=Vibrio lentus TaxID=136468 RepID=UPI000C82FBF2|nr:hypothetical protein [Vibrio lentus]PMH02331.1 hypothetical protein BCU78_11905 [Vibrio lentus]
MKKLRAGNRTDAILLPFMVISALVLLSIPILIDGLASFNDITLDKEIINTSLTSAIGVVAVVSLMVSYISCRLQIGQRVLASIRLCGRNDSLVRITLINERNKPVYVYGAYIKSKPTIFTYQEKFLPLKQSELFDFKLEPLSEKVITIIKSDAFINVDISNCLVTLSTSAGKQDCLVLKEEWRPKQSQFIGS